MKLFYCGMWVKPSFGFEIGKMPSNSDLESMNNEAGTYINFSFGVSLASYFSNINISDFKNYDEIVNPKKKKKTK